MKKLLAALFALALSRGLRRFVFVASPGQLDAEMIADEGTVQHG